MIDLCLDEIEVVCGGCLDEDPELCPVEEDED